MRTPQYMVTLTMDQPQYPGFPRTIRRARVEARRAAKRHGYDAQIRKVGHGIIEVWGVRHDDDGREVMQRIEEV
jgi:hypothetical protein